MDRWSIPPPLRRLGRTGAGRALRAVVARAAPAAGRAVERVRSPVRPDDHGEPDDVLADLADLASARAGPQTVTAMALRLRSPDLAAVMGAVAGSTGKPTWALGEAMALAGVGDDAARSRSLEGLLAVLQAHGTHPFDERQELVLAQLLYLAGRDRELAHILPRLGRIAAPDLEHLRTDLVNPVRAASVTGDAQMWAARFGSTWREAGVPAPTVDPGREGHLFDGLGVAVDDLRRLATDLPLRLGGAGLTGDVLGQPPLVSVVVPAYRPDEGLRTALRSLSQQTWPALEILVVDDGSGPGYTDLFTTAAAVDGRIRVLTQAANGGSYLARNRALREARGKFVTFHDADDWAHPLRMERQVLPMLLDESLPATRSLAMRAHDDLTRQWLGYPAVRVNASSLMMRVGVLARTGMFDPVRKSGDTEFVARLEALTGGTPATVDDVLAITRLRATSLSRGDFSMGWAKPARIAYQGGYRRWHSRLSGSAAGDPPQLPGVTTDRPPRLPGLLDGGPRPFAAPRSYLAARDDAVGSTRATGFDVLLVADLCERQAAGVHLTDLVTGLADDGLALAVLHQEDPTRMRRKRVHTRGELQDLLDAGRAVQVHPEEPTETTLVCVLTPWCLMVARDPPTHLDAAAVWVSHPGPGPSDDGRARLLQHLGRWTPAPVRIEDDTDAAWPDTPLATAMLQAVRRRMASLPP